MMAAIEAATFGLLLFFSGAALNLGQSCSEDRKCPNAKTCCGNVCVVVRKVCKIACSEHADCDSLQSERCEDGFCECVSPSSCANESIWNESGMNKPCEVDSECLRSNAQCLNQTCESSYVVATDETKPEELPLNPALLAIVTIFGVLMFSCTFCCCLSRMKSERKSMKSREAKGKLKSLGIEPTRFGNANSSPLLEAESQDAPPNDKPVTENSKNHLLPRKRDEEMLISVVIENELPPIREEEEEEVEEEGKD